MEIPPPPPFVYTFSLGFKSLGFRGLRFRSFTSPNSPPKSPGPCSGRTAGGSFRKLGVPYFGGPYNKDPTI